MQRQSPVSGEEKVKLIILTWASGEIGALNSPLVQAQTANKH